MTIPFNAEEILDMAITIEKNGAAFYREAAKQTEDPETKKFFESLVTMEEEHGRNFSALKDRWVQADNRTRLFDPDEDAAKILDAWAGGFVFDVRESASSPLAGGEAPEEILRIALRAEKDSTLFYLGLREALKDPGDVKMIDAIIAEEMSHIAELNVIFARLERG